MLTGVHVLLTYACTLSCDHCFVYGGPGVEGTFTPERLRELVHAVAGIEGMESMSFEGGEPFLFYPLMLEGLRAARKHGLTTGIVTNGYWAASPGTAEVFLRPLRELGVGSISISSDDYHYRDTDDNPALRALEAAGRMEMTAGVISIQRPTVRAGDAGGPGRGKPILGGGTRFRGRAAERLTEGLPTRSWKEFTSCDHEDLADPGRVHIDAYGNVHLCQGLIMGNAWETPLAELVLGYEPLEHPIAGPLIRGGPALLVDTYGLRGGDYVEACHCCYEARRRLLGRFPEHLAPPRVYGAGDGGWA